MLQDSQLKPCVIPTDYMIIARRRGGTDGGGSPPPHPGPRSLSQHPLCRTKQGVWFSVVYKGWVHGCCDVSSFVITHVSVGKMCVSVDYTVDRACVCGCVCVCLCMCV